MRKVIYFVSESIDKVDICLTFLCGTLGLLCFFALQKNVYLGPYALTYVLTGMVSYFSLRKFHICKELAFMGGIVYNFLPYHFLCDHDTSSLAYFVIPLMMWFSEVMLKHAEMNYFLACLLMIFTALMSADFAIIWLLFLAFYTGYLIICEKNKEKALKTGCIIFVGICTMFFMSFMPFGLYNGLVKEVLYSSNAMQNRGVKIWALFFPLKSHRIQGVSDLVFQVFDSMGVGDEQHFEALGILMLIGMIVTLITVFCDYRDERMQWLGRLNLGCILLGASSGFWILLSNIKVLRCLSFYKIITVIAFASLMAVLFLLEKLFERYQLSKTIVRSIVILLTIASVWEMTPFSFG